MPAYRKLPPVEEVERLYRSGMTYEEIALKYDVTKSAVAQELSRKGRVPKKVTYRDVLPWKVEPEHRTTMIMRRVRTLAAKQNGIPVTQDAERLLAEWISGMAESGVILNYHPEAPPNNASSAGGFYYTPRDDGEVGLFRQVDPQ